MEHIERIYHHALRWPDPRGPTAGLISKRRVAKTRPFGPKWNHFSRRIRAGSRISRSAPVE